MDITTIILGGFGLALIGFFSGFGNAAGQWYFNTHFKDKAEHVVQQGKKLREKLPTVEVKL